MNVAGALVAASTRLGAAGVADPRREASSLLALALDKPNAFLIAHPEYELTADEAARFDGFAARREKREPFQYIAERQEFYGLEFELTPDVLIPRPETEILVEEAIKELQKLDSPTFCEIGVGSGCISVSILHNVPDATATATDISDRALAVAKRNAERHGVTDRLVLKQGDLFAGVDQKFDMIVSNPPYIPDGDVAAMQSEVRDHEPHEALFGGPDGLDIVRRIADHAAAFLCSNGLLLVEIGAGQAAKLANQFAQDEWDRPHFLSDLQGIPRTLSIRRK
jgi:release factor glutamine methyltransferase